MPIKCEEYNQVCVMSIEGDFTTADAEPARKIVDEMIDKRHIVDFVLDLEHSGFVDSNGLETLLWIKRRAEGLFGQVKLVSLDENLKKIMEITRLEHRFECHPDLTAALKTMS